MATKPIDEFTIEVIRTVRVRVMGYEPGSPGSPYGPPETASEPIGKDIEFEMLLDVGRGVVVALEPTAEEKDDVMAEYEDRQS